MVDVRDPSGAFDDFFEQINDRLSVPRRSRDRMRMIFAAQRRFDRNQHSRLRSREYFADAAALFEMRCLSMDRPLPQWLSEQQPAAAPRSSPRRRRRSR